MKYDDKLFLLLLAVFAIIGAALWRFFFNLRTQQKPCPGE